MNLETQHSFDIAIAMEVGVNKAIILKEVMGWCEQNRRNERNFHEGEYWTYNTAKAYADKFPYMKAGSISRWMNELVEAEWLYKGSFSTKKYDRTLSHRVNREKYLKALQTLISQNEKTISQNDEPITSLTHNNNHTPAKVKITPPSLAEVQQLFKAKISKLAKTVTSDEWAKWDAEEFIEYWQERKWKAKGKSIVPNLSRRVATWVRMAAEKAKYTRPAPNSESYGTGRVKQNVNTRDIELSKKWEASYQRFTKAFNEAMGSRSGKVSQITRSEYVEWSNHQRRRLTSRLTKNNWHKTMLTWIKANVEGMSTYKLQKELKTADALLWHAFSEWMKQRGYWGEFKEPNNSRYPGPLQASKLVAA